MTGSYDKGRQEVFSSPTGIAAGAFKTVFLNIAVFSDILLASSAISYYFFLSLFFLNGTVRVAFGVGFIMIYAISGAFLGLLRSMSVLAETVLTGTEGAVHKAIGTVTGALIAKFPVAASMSMSIDEFRRMLDDTIEKLGSGPEGEAFLKAGFVGRFVGSVALKAVRFVYMEEFTAAAQNNGGVVTAVLLESFAREKAFSLVTAGIRSYTEGVRYVVYAITFVLAVIPFIVAYFLGAF